VVRYRFSEFMLCPRRRILVREGREVPLIPRYFDLLLLLIERRREAVHRREIFERVWADAIVSESALSQAIRTIRRALGDDSREPRFIRTVSRHGYRFVFPDVIEEADDAASSGEPYAAAALSASADTLHAPDTLHGRGAAVAPGALATREVAVARDVAAGADATVGDELLPVGPVGVRQAARIAAQRWTGGAAGGAIAGIAAGAIGGLILAAAPGSFAPIAIAPVLAVIGGGCGALGGAGVGAGLTFAEAVWGSQSSKSSKGSGGSEGAEGSLNSEGSQNPEASESSEASERSPAQRAVALVVCGALGGGLVGAAVQWLTRWGLAALVGLHLDVGGGLEGVVIGSGAGLGFAIATRRMRDGLTAARGGRRALAACIIAICCGLAGLAVILAGRPLAGGTIHIIADAADGSRATLAPLGRLIGEPDFGPISSAILAFGEAAVFGLGLAFGLIRRR
jgi:DNA-binding winged helix-turn-helix (wHTH) protein